MACCSHHSNGSSAVTQCPSQNLSPPPKHNGWELLQVRQDEINHKSLYKLVDNSKIWTDRGLLESMAPATRKKFDEQMRTVLWMLEVVLLPSTPASEKLFLQFFKTTQFQSSIMFLLRTEVQLEVLILKDLVAPYISYSPDIELFANARAADGMSRHYG